MKQEIRINVWEKFGCRCAYCGNGLEYEDMQVDHYRPQCSLPKDKRDDIDNLMPSCRRCNHYKRAWMPEQFRGLMKTLSDKIEKTYLAKVAVDYNILQFKPFDGIFWFEKYTKFMNGEEMECPYDHQHYKDMGMTYCPHCLDKFGRLT